MKDKIICENENLIKSKVKEKVARALKCGYRFVPIVEQFDVAPPVIVGERLEINEHRRKTS